FLIIFAWTPPHFWALALYRRKEYAKAGIPMLPVTHGEEYTRLHLLLYTLLLIATTLLPFATHMAGWFYLGAAVLLATAACDKLSAPRSPFHGTDVTGLEVPGLQLTDPAGQPRTLAEFRNKLVVVIF